MNALMMLSRQQLIKVFIEYTKRYFSLYRVITILNRSTNYTKYIKNVTCIDYTNYTNYNNYKPIFLFKKLFVKPSLESFEYMVQHLMEFDVSQTVFYWIISTLDDMLYNKKIELDAYNMHYYVMLIHSIGVKLLEDSAYDTSEYLEAMGMDVKYSFELEMSLLSVLLSYTTPLKILRACSIDKKLISVMAHVTGKSVETITLLDINDKNDNNIFYNR